MAFACISRVSIILSCFVYSFESMAKLCERYNRAIDGILQLVSISKHHALWDPSPEAKIKAMSSAGAKVENSGNDLELLYRYKYYVFSLDKIA